MRSRLSTWLPSILALGALASLCIDAAAQRPERPSGGSGGSSHSRPSDSGGGGHSSAPSRPSAPEPSRPAPSRPSAPDVSRPAPSQPSRPTHTDPAPVSRPAPEPTRPSYSPPARTNPEPVRPSNDPTPSGASTRSGGADSGARDSGRARPDSGWQGSSTPSRVYDSARNSAADRGTPGTDRDTRAGTDGSRPGRGEVDLSGFGRARRSEVPALSSSSGGLRPVRDPAASPALAQPLRTRPMTRESLLERYRPIPARDSDLARARERAEGGLSRVRGGKLVADGVRTATRAPRSSRAVSTELGQQQYDHTRKRIEALAQKDPKRAREIMHGGEALAIASDISLRVGLGASLGFCGGSSGWTWWDPCNHGYSGSSWWYACGPCSWWWWNGCSYWWPNWGWGYSWGPGWSQCGLSWYSHPNWSYPGYHYWGCSPWWYTSVIYVDDYTPPAPQVVVVHEPAAQPEPQAPAPAAGEANAPAQGEPQKRDPILAKSLARTAQQYVALGDLAFSERRYGDAVSHYAKAIEYSPDDGVLYMLLADALFATGDYHYAAYALRKSLDLEPRLVDTIVDKHAVYTDPDDFEKQLGYLEGYLKDNFGDSDARLVLAANYLFGNKPHQALDLLDSAFSEEVRKTSAGTLLRERARALASENPFSK